MKAQQCQWINWLDLKTNKIHAVRINKALLLRRNMQSPASAEGANFSMFFVPLPIFLLPHISQAKMLHFINLGPLNLAVLIAHFLSCFLCLSWPIWDRQLIRKIALSSSVRAACPSNSTGNMPSCPIVKCSGGIYFQWWEEAGEFWCNLVQIYYSLSPWLAYWHCRQQLAESCSSLILSETFIVVWHLSRSIFSSLPGSCPQGPQVAVFHIISYLTLLTRDADFAA